MSSKMQPQKSAPTKKSIEKPISKDPAVILATIALTHRLLDAESEKKAEKKKKFLNKLKLSTEDERRAAIENGKIKFVHQEVRKSNLKKIVANNCVIVGDNNNVIGNDNVLIGLNNKATGENNKIVTPGATTVIARTDAVPAAVAAGTSNTAPTASAAIPAPEQPTSYYSEEYLTLPDNWIQMNGVIIYREEDINAILKWILRDWSITTRGRTEPAYVEGAPMTRNFSMAETVYAFLPPSLLEIASRYGIPPKENAVASAQLRGHALAFGKIPMPPDMPPSTRAPKKQEHKITMPYFSRETAAGAQTPALSLSTVPPTPTPPPSASTATQKSKKPNFLPAAGIASENSNWKCSLLDLPGTADVAGEDEPTCKICLVNRMDVVFEPCHCVVTCRDCAKALVEMNSDHQNCPKCRARIEYGSILFLG